MRRLAGVARRRLRAAVAPRRPLRLRGAGGGRRRGAAGRLPRQRPRLAPPAPSRCWSSASPRRRLPDGCATFPAAPSTTRWPRRAAPTWSSCPPPRWSIRGAWAAMVDVLEETGSDLVLGAARTDEPRPWAGELHDGRRLRQTKDTCPLALVDLSLSHKMFRLASWRRAGGVVGGLPAVAGGESAVMAAYLDAAAFDVLPRVVSDVLATDADRPVAERARFSASRVGQRLDALVDAARVGPSGVARAGRVVPPAAAVRRRGRRGRGRTCTSFGSGCPSSSTGWTSKRCPSPPGSAPGRPGTAACTTSRWCRTCSPTTRTGSRPSTDLVPLPDGMSTAVPDDWRRITAADRRPGRGSSRGWSSRASSSWCAAPRSSSTSTRRRCPWSGSALAGVPRIEPGRRAPPRPARQRVGRAGLGGPHRGRLAGDR